MSDEIKYCKFCNKEKPIREFVKSGFAIKNICRECQNKKQAQIYRDSKKVKELEKENQELKKQLEEYEHHLKISKEMLDLQRQDGNYNYDNYMLGLYNGMEYIMSLFEVREPIFKDGKNIKFLNDKNQQKEFIEWLEQNIENEEYCYLAQKPSERCRKDVFEEVLSKYKEIIGVKDE